jgi:hypothetical protein
MQCGKDDTQIFVQSDDITFHFPGNLGLVILFLDLEQGPKQAADR